VLPLLILLGLALPGLSGCVQGENASARVHPAFALSTSQLEKALSGLSRETREAVLGRGQVFLDLMEGALQGPQDLLLYVDKTRGLPPEYEPSDLVDLNGYPLAMSKRNLRLRKPALPDLLAMAESARLQGIELVISSAYRSYAYQEEVYRRNLLELGQEKADRESARPGHSQHQLGTCIDFGSIDDSFAATPASQWLAANAWRFGFSLSYPQGQEQATGYRYEPWHYRYLGREAARLVTQFFPDRQQGFLAFYEAKCSFFTERMRDSPGPAGE